MITESRCKKEEKRKNKWTGYSKLLNRFIKKEIENTARKIVVINFLKNNYQKN